MARTLNEAEAFALAMSGWDDFGDYTVDELTPEAEAEYELIKTMHAAGKLSSKNLQFIIRARIAVANPEMNAKADEIVHDLVRCWGA